MRQVRIRFLAVIDGPAVIRIRETLHLSRAELGALLGFSRATIGAWERGGPVPVHAAALLGAFDRAAIRCPAAIVGAGQRLRQAAPVRALYELLHAAYRKEDPRSRVRPPARLRAEVAGISPNRLADEIEDEAILAKAPPEGGA